MKKIIFFFSVVFLFVVLHSCNNNPLKVDVNEVEVGTLEIDRMEQDIFDIDTNNLVLSAEKLQEKYGEFFNTYLKGILNNGGLKDTQSMYLLKRFIGDADMREAYEHCLQTYPDVAFLEEEINMAFKYYAYHFPDRPLPRVVTMMSGFNYPSVYTDNTLAIGLEMYLGGACKFYSMLALPQYKVMFMNKKSIAVDAFRTWMFAEFPYNMNQNNFLSDIVFLGKILYLSDAMFPDMQDSIKIQYTQKQLDYAIQNEYNLWTYFVAQKVLYTTNHAEILKYTSDGPFSSAISKDCPPRIAYWIGWQIVRQYMRNNPDITPEELMKQTDAQIILSKSKYKPKK